MPHCDALPFDVWDEIITYLTKKECQFLCQVHRNSRMVEAARRQVFRDVSFVGDRQDIKRVCNHLGHNYAGALVRRVYLSPWNVLKHLKESTGRARFLDVVRSITDPNFKVAASVATRVQKAVQKDVRLIESTFSSFSDVLDYKVVFGEEFKGCPKLTQAFLGRAIFSMGPRLKRLDLNIPLRALMHLGSINNLLYLEELTIMLYSEVGPARLSDVSPKEREKEIEDERKDVDYCLDALTIFVNNITYLRSLSITTSPNSRRLNLSHLFRHIGRFPRLRSFSLCIPAEGSHLYPLTHFLAFISRNSHTIRSFSLTTSRLIPSPDTHPSPLWIQDIATHLYELQIPLESVTMSLRRSLKDHITPYTDLIYNLQPSLDTLTFTDRNLNFDLISTILPARLHMVKRLSIQTMHVSLQLLIHLATNFPNLKELRMDSQNADNILALCYELAEPAPLTSTAALQAWPLRLLQITYLNNKMERKLLVDSYATHSILERAIPSLQIGGSFLSVNPTTGR